MVRDAALPHESQPFPLVIFELPRDAAHHAHLQSLCSTQRIACASDELYGHVLFINLVVRVFKLIFKIQDQQLDARTNARDGIALASQLRGSYSCGMSVSSRRGTAPPRRCAPFLIRIWRLACAPFKTSAAFRTVWRESSGYSATSAARSSSSNTNCRSEPAISWLMLSRRARFASSCCFCTHNETTQSII